jgi:hypothetical protein
MQRANRVGNVIKENAMRMTLTLCTAALALAACQDAPSEETDPMGAESDIAMPVEPDGGIGDGATPPAGMANGSDVTQIPAAFQGRWGMNANDCDPAQADIAKGLMEVSATQLTFYESVGTLDDVETSGPTSLSAEFDFTGEGMEWERDMTMTLEDDGDTLIRRESGEDAMPGPQRYTKCPA